DLRGAGDDLRAALRAGVSGPTRARLLARHARLAAGAEDLSRAGELVRLALAETEGDPQARAAALYAGSIVDMNTDRSGRSRERSDEALRLFSQVGDAHGIADVLDARAMATFLDGRNQEAVSAFDRVARMFEDAGDLLRVVTPRSTRGHGLVFLGQPGRALRETEQALELARSLDYPEGVSYALWHRSESLSGLGRVDEAVNVAREAIEVAQRLGHRSWTVSAHRALGVALHARGDLDAAEDAFRAALELATHWPLFASWAAARIAMIRVARGDPAGAEPYVTRALGQGPPLAHYEARLARAELAAARHEPDASAIARDALARAEEGGHLVAVARLTELARR
ncbi:MAG: tetratricopeptide repeat protein, partial [Haloechinothrix sp.]